MKQSWPRSKKVGSVGLRDRLFGSLEVLGRESSRDEFVQLAIVDILGLEVRGEGRGGGECPHAVVQLKTADPFPLESPILLHAWPFLRAKERIRWMDGKVTVES